MTTVKLSHPNPLPVAEAKRRLGGAIDRYCRIYGVQPRWEGDTLVLTGALANGRARFGADAVDVEIELGAGADTKKDHDDVESTIREYFARELRA